MGGEQMVRGLVCLDMDRVLVDHLSTWQFVYDQMGISNDESFNLYNQGLLDEWSWIKLDLALIKSASSKPVSDEYLRSLMEGMPMMKGWRLLIQHLLDHDVAVAIVSGGLQKTARDIAAEFPSESEWTRRWGGIDRQTATEKCQGKDTRLHVFTNGWLMEGQLKDGSYGIGDFGRYQVQMNGKGAIVRMLQRRIGVEKSQTASVGDSMGDAGMFEESSCAILFNPWDDRPRAYANHVIEEKDLALVLNVICDSLSLPKP
jgi:phosphoserine phosphatase